MQSFKTSTMTFSLAAICGLHGCSAPTASAHDGGTVRVMAFGYMFAADPVVVAASSVRQAEVRIEQAHPDTLLWAHRGDVNGTYRVQLVALRNAEGREVYKDSTQAARSLRLFRADESLFTPLRVSTVGVAILPHESDDGSKLPAGRYFAYLQIHIVAATSASFAVLSELPRSVELTLPIEVR